MYLQLSHLNILAPHPEYLLAMKCLAMRLGEEFHDVDDIRTLVHVLGLASVAQAESVIAKYYPLDRFPARARYALEELLAAGPG